MDLIDTEILFDDARFGSNYSPSGCASMGLQMKLLQFFEDPKQCVFEFQVDLRDELELNVVKYVGVVPAIIERAPHSAKL